MLSFASDYDQLYQEMLTARLRYVTESSPAPLSLYELIQLSEGASPLDVTQVLDAHNFPYYTDQRAGKQLVIDKVNVGPVSQSSLFAAPHPADYDWRFTEKTIDRLTYRVQQSLSNSRGKVALFGVQTLYPRMANLGLRLTLFNKSQSLLNDLRKAGYKNGLVEFDLFNQATAYVNQFDVVVADPPWYPDFYKAFIARSAEVLLLNGYLLISVLPRLTRPSANQDRQQLLTVIEELGFEFVHSEERFFEYETPGFEQIALATQGLYCVDWRLGDLWIIQKKRQIQTPFVILYPDDEPAWREFRVGNRKIKVKQVTREATSFNYEPADPSGKFYKSVSRRSPFRHRIDVWTSDNLAYNVTQVSDLMTCLTILEQGGTVDEVVHYLNQVGSLSEHDQLQIINLLRELS